ncbi:MAG: hypothetical protein ACK5MN_01635 [Lachnospiraceae bacterium]
MIRENLDSIQTMVLPDPGSSDKVQLYYRLLTDRGLEIREQDLVLGRGSVLAFDTYFNAFSVGKWGLYSVLDGIEAKVSATGALRISCKYKYLSNDTVVEELLHEVCVESADFIYQVCGQFPMQTTGMYYLEIEALQDSVLRDISYCPVTKQTPREIRLALGICTYKREKYLFRNLDEIKAEILHNADSPLRDKLTVYVSDNGNSIDSYDTTEAIRIFPNKNTGGAGGFTRTIIEALPGEHTHIILMDDDVVIRPYVLERTWHFLRFLQEAYEGCQLAGGLLRLDRPGIQYESGAQWNEGRIVALKHNVDLRDTVQLLRNENEDVKTEYSGWWYCCIPRTQISEDNLPLPIFIHRDDIEYGLRIGTGFLSLNGIGVWHEAFENKMPGAQEYYAIRNLCITNAIHAPSYSARRLKRLLLRWVTGNIVRYRYRYVNMNLKGAIDFCKGIDWLMRTDAQKLHMSLMRQDYQYSTLQEILEQNALPAQLLRDTTGQETEQPPEMKHPTGILQRCSLNGLLLPAERTIPVVVPHASVDQYYRKKHVICRDTAGKALLFRRDVSQIFKCYRKLFRTFREIDKSYENARQEYKSRYKQMTAVDFWWQYLDI